ncbi:Hypothetical predicted protein [Podarcis lilfordi]|uniref:Uncharacterized protein n=1 Tax=Podarcis lilfordi TaxID=74358 RepID=A0AA35PDB0_9SAUR|nr:Hypothetical predicted protein [Podarcis lilfordi]
MEAKKARLNPWVLLQCSCCPQLCGVFLTFTVGCEAERSKVETNGNSVCKINTPIFHHCSPPIFLFFIFFKRGKSKHLKLDVQRGGFSQKLGQRTQLSGVL